MARPVTSTLRRHCALSINSSLSTVTDECAHSLLGKANSNLSILALFKDLGAGFDIVSGGELSRVLTVGGDPADVIFSGVGKSVEEIDLALKVGIGCFNVESHGELSRIEARASIGSGSRPCFDPSQS
ncbi:MAG: hypothetical protein CM15mP68_6500 [Pseudomonadota bacterium]|nr:MAG: hypothetical protein CM15mP68_6500 [Pseudomonadota bacterium]